MTEIRTLAGQDVSRETIEKLLTYQALIEKWNPAINLVARSTIGALWDRHFSDSAQLYRLAPATSTAWADLGSGGGFPGLIVAILAAGEGRHLDMTLVESDQRKSVFLQAAARAVDVPVKVLAKRAEALPPMAVDVLTARALAPLEKLLTFAERHLAPEGCALFPKGANHEAELREALEKAQFSYETTTSATDPGAVIYKIWGISRV
jgi:16S rRNA (guanine527-N7)-methyltransferase